MEKDKNTYGKMMELIHPKKKIPRIEPPIRRWEIKDGTVTRENGVVIRNVVVDNGRNLE